MHKRGQILRRGWARPGEASARLSGDQVIQVSGGHATTVGQAGRAAGGTIRPDREDGVHPRLAGHDDEPLPELRVQLRPGRDEDP